MRIAILSDVHSNLPALETVLESIDRLGVDRIFCAGDIVGYYPFPREVIQLLRRRGVRSILGNHDIAVLERDVSRMNHDAGEAARWTWEHIGDEEIEYMQGLPESLRWEQDGVIVAMYHGSPKSVWEYVYPKFVVPELITLADCEVLILGHTHVPMVKDTGKGAVINPGSVGQPRDGDPRASYMLMDLETGELDLVREEYDIQAVISALDEEGILPQCGERLSRGI